jgi:hypothetical protein
MNKISFLFIVLITTAGCAASLGKEISVNASIPVDEIKNSYGHISNSKVIIQPFIDSRSQTFVAEIEGRKISPKGDIGNAVQTLFYRYFKRSGVGTVLYGAPIIDGEVTDWRVNIDSGFPLTKILATASINLNLKDIQGNVVYSANYSGETKTLDPFPTTGKVEKSLSLAMAEAVKQAVEDKNILDKLQVQ